MEEIQQLIKEDQDNAENEYMVDQEEEDNEMEATGSTMIEPEMQPPQANGFTFINGNYLLVCDILSCQNYKSFVYCITLSFLSL